MSDEPSLFDEQEAALPDPPCARCGRSVKTCDGEAKDCQEHADFIARHRARTAAFLAAWGRALGEAGRPATRDGA